MFPSRYSTTFNFQSFLKESFKRYPRIKGLRSTFMFCHVLSVGRNSWIELRDFIKRFLKNYPNLENDGANIRSLITFFLNQKLLSIKLTVRCQFSFLFFFPQAPICLYCPRTDISFLCFACIQPNDRHCWTII